jgi:hypothetical protein
MKREYLCDLFRKDLEKLIQQFEAQLGCRPDTLFVCPAFAQVLCDVPLDGPMIFDGLQVFTSYSVAEPVLARMSMLLEHLSDMSDRRTLH